MGTHMANQFAANLEKGIVHVYGYFTIGDSGAPTLVKGKNQGIQAITRNSTGDYTVTFGDSVQLTTDKYQRLMFMEAAVAYASTTAIVSIVPLADTTASGTMEFVCSSATTTAADPESGSVLLVHFVLKNSTVV